MGCDLEVEDEINPFYHKLLLVMVFISASEWKPNRYEFVTPGVTTKLWSGCLDTTKLPEYPWRVESLMLFVQ